MAFNQQAEYLQFGNYRLTAQQGKCISCRRAVPIFAAENPFGANVTVNCRKFNTLERICLDCAIYDLERVKLLPRYYMFAGAAKENDNIEIEKLDNCVEDLGNFSLSESTNSNLSSGLNLSRESNPLRNSGNICDCNVKENHEFAASPYNVIDNANVIDKSNVIDNSSNFISITERYKIHDGSGPGSNYCDETGLFSGLKKHVNYPRDLNYLGDFSYLTANKTDTSMMPAMPKKSIPFELPTGVVVHKRAKIEEKMRPPADPDFIFGNYQHYSGRRSPSEQNSPSEQSSPNEQSSHTESNTRHENFTFNDEFGSMENSVYIIEANSTSKNIKIAKIENE